MLDGLVITGGEPTILSDLFTFIQKVKDLGLLVKLDTNGSNQKVMESLLTEDLLDYVAMDIKSAFDRVLLFFGFRYFGLARNDDANSSIHPNDFPFRSRT